MSPPKNNNNNKKTFGQHLFGDLCSSAPYVHHFKCSFSGSGFSPSSGPDGLLTFISDFLSLPMSAAAIQRGTTF